MGKLQDNKQNSDGGRWRKRRPLRADKKCDTCIVGAGITGVTLAYLLIRSGRSVVIIDDGTIGGEDTSRSTAHLSVHFDTPYEELIRIHGVQAARLAYESQVRAFNTIRAIVARERIDCAFKHMPAYMLPAPEQREDIVFCELRACRTLGMEHLSLLPAAEVPFAASEAVLRLQNQGSLDVLAYVRSLVQTIERCGGKIYGSTHAYELTSEGNESKILLSNHAVITADNVVFATHAPVIEAGALHAKQFPYRTYVVKNDLDAAGVIPDCLIWDMGSPYHYAHVQTGQDGGRTLVSGGEDHRTGQAGNAEERYNNVEAWAKQLIPGVQMRRSQWSGQIYETVDGLPFIGNAPQQKENVFIATGFAGCGISLGTLSALIIRDLICKQTNRAAALFSPLRSSKRALRRYLCENFASAVHYRRRDKVVCDLNETGEGLHCGEGTVVYRSDGPIAISKDEHGQLLECSAVCPHLKSVVSWNGSEKTWDCPAHGSRFDAYGRVVNGPANCNLGRASSNSHARIFEDAS